MVEQQQHDSRKRRRFACEDAPLQQPQAYVENRNVVFPPRKRTDDREGHFEFNLGDNLTPRYKILSKMGEGTFGRVLECWDRQTREYVAIKVVRSIHKYREAAMIEIDVLEQLTKNDKGGSHCVQIQTWFDYCNHICIVLDGVTHVICGVLVAYLLNSAREKLCFRHMRIWSIWQ